jgi:hypothetical protein
VAEGDFGGDFVDVLSARAGGTVEVFGEVGLLERFLGCGLHFPEFVTALSALTLRPARRVLPEDPLPEHARKGSARKKNRAPESAELRAFLSARSGMCGMAGLFAVEWAKKVEYQGFLADFDCVLDF